MYDVTDGDDMTDRIATGVGHLVDEQLAGIGDTNGDADEVAGRALDADALTDRRQPRPVHLADRLLETAGEAVQPGGQQHITIDVRQCRRSGGRPAQVAAHADDDVVDSAIDRAGLGEDASKLGAVEQEIVRPLQRRTPVGARLDRLGGGNGDALGQLVRVGRVEAATEQHRDEEVRPRWGVPPPIQPTTPRGLVIGHQHGPVRCANGRASEKIDVGRARLDDVSNVPHRVGRVGDVGPGGIHTQRFALVLSKILIANRGEIAVRVIRACRELGIASVAVYSELDRNALHVRLADEAYALGGQTAAESYLNTDAILDAIEKSGADGVHPGYGFFSENADFARAIQAKGVAFIGPPASAIDEMGDKVSSRKAALRGGAPIVPGTTEFVTSADEITEFGNANGWPLAIKAAFGGGGRGMKVVRAADEVASAMESAQREAKAFFGRDEIYIERYLTWPRHVEVQLVGDQHGNCVWVSTRDCSAQRRHQKLIEEAPAPALAPGIEAAMGAAAVKAAKAVGYFNAGTVEFIYQDEEFFFLEMNTRLQVEHPVTEVITGIDLVEWQIRVASGESLPMTQDEVAAARRGHAIEVRINAENPAGGRFLPSPGTITTLRAAQGFGTRWDGGYEAGDEISQYYDNLIGKLIVWGKDRPTAIARTIRALEEMEVVGVATTIPADLAILRHADFQAVTHSTKWVEETLDLSGIAAPAKPMPMADGDADGVAVPLVERKTTVEVNGKRFDVKLWVPESAPVAVAAGAGAPAGRKPARVGGSGAAAGAGSGDVAVPMQGTIVKVLVEVGQAVDVGQPVVVLEAMKMENQIQAEKAGTVTEIRVSPGDTVGAGDIVVVIA